jgi:glycosyltransferase involved in cell wall biosynthesis
MKIAVLIPAFKPDNLLLEIVNQLSQADFTRIVIVNDGSGPSFRPIFDLLLEIPNVDVLDHPINLGKGAALKTGFHYILSLRDKVDGVITADADGQHSKMDILRIAEEMDSRKNGMILGVRQFDKKVPIRSIFGNLITRWILKYFFKLNLSDTQTGLRGIPAQFLPSLLEIPYNRYEYELEMLMVCKRKGIPIYELPIQTIYINQNKSSHFNPLIDSTKVYFVLFRYMIASLITALVDYIVFILVYSISQSVPIGIFFARGVAIIVNYTLLRNMVFYSRTALLKTFPKYVLLVLVCGVISAYFIQILVSSFNLQVVLAKVISELSLYFIVYILQKRFVFSEKNIFEK